MLNTKHSCPGYSEHNATISFSYTITDALEDKPQTEKFSKYIILLRTAVTAYVTV